MYFFTSDTHFGDDEVLKQDLRPFKNAKQFSKKLIKTWNKQAGKNDIIYVIGDFVDCDGDGYDSWKTAILLVKKIKAQVVLIIGNNEQRIIKYYFDNDFEKFKNYCLSIGYKDVLKNTTIQMQNQDFFLTHKPLDYNPNCFNLFGHMHASGGIYKPFGFNVGCDLSHYRLLSQNDIFHFIDKKIKFWDNDKHLNMNIKLNS